MTSYLVTAYTVRYGQSWIVREQAVVAAESLRSVLEAYGVPTPRIRQERDGMGVSDNCHGQVTCWFRIDEGTRQCTRCAGTGMIESHVPHKGIPGLCLTCDGAGHVVPPTAEARAKKQAGRDACERETRLRMLLKTSVDADRRALVLAAVTELETREPGRYAKMLDSLDAGRTEAVIEHLVTYLRELPV